MKRIEQISLEAAAWKMEFRDHPPTPARWAEFERWVADPVHKQEFVAMERTASVVAEHGLAALEREKEVSLAAAIPRAPFFNGGTLGLLAAGVILGVAMALFFMHPYAAQPEAFHMQNLAAQTGELKHIELEDGSVVTMNADTAMDVRWSARSRKVTFTRGEAVFDVAHDGNRPFDVVIDAVVVRALGTHFSVRRYGDGRMDVLLVEGRISVSVAGQSRILLPGSRARVEGQAIDVTEVSPEDQQRVLEWTQRRIDFPMTPLREIAAEFNRYNSVKLYVEDPALANMKIGGSFLATRPDRFATALRGLSPAVCARVTPQAIYLRSCASREPVRVQQ